MLKPSIAHSLVRANGLSLSLVRLVQRTLASAGRQGSRCPVRTRCVKVLKQLTANASANSTRCSSCSLQWVPPNYWLTDPGIVGGAFGFLTEGGPGENPMVFESLAKTVSPAALWPPSPDDCWGHCANPQGALGTLARFNGPLAERYGVNASNISLGARSYLYAAHAQASLRFLSFVKHRFAVVLLSSCHNFRRTRDTGPCSKAILETKAALGVITAWSSLQTRRG